MKPMFRLLVLLAWFVSGPALELPPVSPAPNPGKTRTVPKPGDADFPVMPRAA